MGTVVIFFLQLLQSLCVKTDVTDTWPTCLLI